MPPLFFIKQNDTSPGLESVLKDREDGTAINLTDATVVFNMRDKNTLETKISRQPCTVYDAANGIVRYSWSVEDTSTIGTFLGEFEVTYTSGKVETFPHAEYITIIILDDVA